MIIYLADLLHTGQGKSRDHVPIAAGYLAAASKKRFPDLDITIFRDPHLLLKTIRITKPDIVGFSSYAWSERLSSFAAKKVKEMSPKTITVAGGPSIDDNNEELVEFLKTFPCYDIVVPNEGEISFINIIEHVKKNSKLVPDRLIEGCARLASNGALLRGKYVRPELEDLPSPYLEGWMDPFLKEGYLPILQSMRGCPYSCKYCCSGTRLWSKLRAFDLNRVFAEFEYMREHAKRSYLFLTDENQGLLKERDVKLAQYVRESYERTGYPSYINTYTDKHFTPYVQRISELLQPIADFNVSFQTLNETARRAVNRVNLSVEDASECLKWAREKGIATSTEMIFGFPGETAESFTSSLELLLRAGFDRVYSYELRLLRGSELFTKANREKYALKTKFRMTEHSFGIYEGAVVVDMEEVVVSSNTFGFDDYLEVRKYGFFFFLAFTTKYFSDLIRIMVELNMPGEKLVRHLVDYDYKKNGRLRPIIEQYNKRCKQELFDSPDECTEFVRNLVVGKKSVPATKLNMIFLGKIMFDSSAREELLGVVKEFACQNSSCEKVKAFFIDYIENVLSKQIVDFGCKENINVMTQTNVNVENLRKLKYKSVDDLLMEQKIMLQLSLDDQVVTYMDKNQLSGLDNEILLEDIFLSNMRWLKRNLKIIHTSPGLSGSKLLGKV